jgi:bacillithiol system protein YtxJ
MDILGFFKGNDRQGAGLPWQQLTDPAQLDGILAEDASRPAVIFKHSTRCSISSMSLKRFEREWDTSARADIWLLDLLRHRDISDAITERTGVMHQSPQTVLIVSGKVAHHASHSAISAVRIMESLGL